MTMKNGNRWTDEAEQLTEGLPEGSDTEQLRRTIRSNCELLSQLRPPAAPAALWSRVESAIKSQPAEPVIVPMPAAGARRWTALLAAGLALAAGVAWYTGPGRDRPSDPDGKTPVVVAPSAEQVLAAAHDSLRSTAFEGTAVVEDFNPDAPNAAPLRRTVKIAFDGKSGNWRLTPDDANGREIIRNGGRQFVRQAGAAGKTEWAIGAADDLGRVPPDNLALDPAALAAAYTLSVGGPERLLGRECRMVTVASKSAGRPGAKLWIDSVTGVRLKTERTDAEGRLTARTTFGSFTDAGIASTGLFDPPVSVGNDAAARLPSEYQAERDRSRLGFVPFTDGGLPAGFALRRTVLLSGATGLPALRTTYSDGLAVVEMYQQASASGRDAGPTYRKVGRMGEVTLDRGGVSITIGGELDRAALEAVAAGLNR